MAFSQRYAERVRQFLLAAEMGGITFRELNQKVRTPNFKGADLRALIDSWKARGWVDEFDVKKSYSIRRYTYLRGTNLLYKEWPIYKEAVHDLLAGPPIGNALGRDYSQK